MNNTITQPKPTKPLRECSSKRCPVAILSRAYNQGEAGNTTREEIIKECAERACLTAHIMGDLNE